MAVLRQIGVALELPFEILVGHFTASYSAAQAAILSAWRFFMGRRDFMADNYCQLIFNAWLEEAVSIGRVKAMGYFSDPMIMKAYQGGKWVGPAKGHIDPLKSIRADKEHLIIGTKTGAEITQEYTGGDYDSNIEIAKKEKQMRIDAGLEMPMNNGGM